MEIKCENNTIIIEKGILIERLSLLEAKRFSAQLQQSIQKIDPDTKVFAIIKQDLEEFSKKSCSRITKIYPHVLVKNLHDPLEIYGIMEEYQLPDQKEKSNQYLSGKDPNLAYDYYDEIMYWTGSSCGINHPIKGYSKEDPYIQAMLKKEAKATAFETFYRYELGDIPIIVWKDDG